LSSRHIVSNNFYAKTVVVSTVSIRKVITDLTPKHHTRNGNTLILFDYSVKSS